MADGISSVSIAPTADGCLLRVRGRGTVRESRVIKDVGTRTLKGDANARVFLDIADCTYVDSTFLGMLIDLHRSGDSKRFSVVAPLAQRQKLLGIARLDKLIACVDSAPSTVGESHSIPSLEATPREIVKHVMECHRRLAEVDCPMRQIFARIADQMEKELETQV
jgi:anti-anti-sigma regulatory factor